LIDSGQVDAWIAAHPEIAAANKQSRKQMAYERLGPPKDTNGALVTQADYDALVAALRDAIQTARYMALDQKDNAGTPEGWRALELKWSAALAKASP
jgi:ABC-type nitrate/sulfonate/bicarbonate transport system substrate-binding protein